LGGTYIVCDCHACDRSVSPRAADLYATSRASSAKEYTDDEAFARALQQEEEREVMSRLIAAQMGLAGEPSRVHLR